MTFFSARRVLLATAVLAAVTGLVFAMISAAQPVSFGWVAYAPLSGDIFSPGGAQLVSPPTILGLAIMTLGLLGLAFWAGLTVGLRRRCRPAAAESA